MNTSRRQPKPAPEPGCHKSVPADDYHSWAAVSASLLKACERSLAHGKAWLDDEPEELTDALRFGGAYHAFLFEPEQFKTRYRVMDKFERRTDKAKAEWAALCQDPGERFIVWTEERKRMERMRERVAAHPRGRVLIEAGGLSECSFVWTDKETGLPCKCRADRLARVGGWTLIDLKTAEDARPREFGRAAATYGYDIAAEWYVNGIAQATGTDRLPFAFIVQEKDPPYPVQVYSVDESELSVGRALIRQRMTDLAKCIESGVWPSYVDDIVPFALPMWRYKQAEELEVVR